jgi:hypothetical protein
MLWLQRLSVVGAKVVIFVYICKRFAVFLASFGAIMMGGTASFRPPNRHSQAPKPPFSRNKSIEIVERFHWFCSTIPLTSLNDSIGFVSEICRFCFRNLPFKLLLSGRFLALDSSNRADVLASAIPATPALGQGQRSLAALLAENPRFPQLPKASVKPFCRKNSAIAYGIHLGDRAFVLFFHFFCK